MDELKKLVKSVSIHLNVDAVIKLSLLIISLCILVLAISNSSILAMILATITGCTLGVWLTGIFQNKKTKAIALIHEYVDETEYSLYLLEKNELNFAEQLQLERLEFKFDVGKFPLAKLYSGLGWYGGLLLFSVVFYSAFPHINFGTTDRKIAAHSENKEENVNLLTAPVFESAKVSISPPSYTALSKRESANLNVSAISGSVLQWAVRFNHDKNLVVRLANSRGEEVLFKNVNGLFNYSDRLTGSGLYAIKAYWKDSVVYQSDFYRLEALPDLAPKIEPASKELYKYHLLNDSKIIKISAKVSDDFRVKRAFIVATVARGSGENVKFREVKIPLTPANFKQANLQKVINLAELNFAPGDELYYYWAAIDNKQPDANFSKTDTYFLVYKDTAQVEEAELATMAVNIMPEYFRSQRQIIIDTGKLIAKRKRLSSKDFNSTSNEIGFDQKVLRMRYGQYLGEEFETTIGGAGGPPPNHDSDQGSKNILDAFTHKSDGEGEAAERRASEPVHPESHDHSDTQHGGESQDPLAALMEQYVHSHDDAETNTFYEQSTRSLLKMALEQMWQSELHLRMYEPEKAIPFEHKALEYLKSAQHKARTFVKKSGYDPPPIKEKEKRLSGEMKEINTSLNSEKLFDQKRTEQLAAEISGYLEYTQLNNLQRAKLQQTCSALSERLMNSGPLNGGFQNWPVIGSLQKLVSNKMLSVKEKQKLKAELYKLSNLTVQSKQGYSSNKKLEEVFWKKLR